MMELIYSTPAVYDGSVCAHNESNFQPNVDSNLEPDAESNVKPNVEPTNQSTSLDRLVCEVTVISGHCNKRIVISSTKTHTRL